MQTVSMDNSPRRRQLHFSLTHIQKAKQHTSFPPLPNLWWVSWVGDRPSSWKPGVGSSIIQPPPGRRSGSSGRTGCTDDDHRDTPHGLRTGQSSSVERLRSTTSAEGHIYFPFLLHTHTHTYSTLSVTNSAIQFCTFRLICKSVCLAGIETVKNNLQQTRKQYLVVDRGNKLLGSSVVCILLQVNITKNSISLTGSWQTNG